MGQSAHPQVVRAATDVPLRQQRLDLPLDWQQFGPFSTELRAFIIVDQGQLDSFESAYVSKVSRGNATTLGRIDFDTSVLLAAYYLWRPVRETR